MAADGVANSQIAAKVGVTPVTVRAWRGRFADEGLAKLGQVRQGRGRKPGISAEKVEQIVRLAVMRTIRALAASTVPQPDDQLCGQGPRRRQVSNHRKGRCSFVRYGIE